MLTIIPAIDIIGGKCVRLSKGNYAAKKIYSDDPVKVARSFEDHGLQRLHLVDLDGARTKHVVNWPVLEKIASTTQLIIDFGGGIKSEEDLQIVFNCGARIATIGSIAVKNKALFFTWLNQYGVSKFILGADVNNRKIAVSGWTEQTEIDIISFLNEYIQQGVEQILCTDIGKDGMLGGTSTDLYKDLLQYFPKIKLIASGGITSIEEIYKLDELGVSGAVIGKAIYEGKITLKELEKYVRKVL